MKVYLLVVPNLRKGYERAVLKILEFPERLDRILIPLPEDMNDELLRYLLGEISIEQLVKDTAIELESNTRAKLMTPLLKGLKIVAKMLPPVEIVCYLPREVVVKYSTIYSRIIRLLYRVRISGRVDVGAWRSVLSDLESRAEVLNGILANRVYHYLKKTTLIIASGESIVKWLRNWGVEVEVVHALEDYIPNPLEALMNTKVDRVDDTTLEELVKEALNYIFEYIVCSRDIDEAYAKWVKKVRRK